MKITIAEYTHYLNGWIDERISINLSMAQIAEIFDKASHSAGEANDEIVFRKPNSYIDSRRNIK